MHKKKCEIISLSCLLAAGTAFNPAGLAVNVRAKENESEEFEQTNERSAAPPALEQTRGMEGTIASLLRTFNSHLENNRIGFRAHSPFDVRRFSELVSFLSRKLGMDFVYFENDPDQELEKLLMTIGKEFSEVVLLLSNQSSTNMAKCEEIFNRLFAKADDSAPTGVATQFMDALEQQGNLNLVLDGWLEASHSIGRITGNEDPVLVDAQNKVQSLQTRQADFVLSQCLSDLYSGYSAELEKIDEQLNFYGTNPFDWIMKGKDENSAVITLNLTFSDSKTAAKFTSAQVLNLDSLSNVDSVLPVIAADGKSVRISFSLKPDISFNDFFMGKNIPQIQVKLEKTFVEGEVFKKGIDIQVSWSVSNISHQMDAGTILTDMPVTFSFEMRPVQCSLEGPGTLDFFTAKQSPDTPAKPSDPADKPLNPPAAKPSDKPSEEKQPVNLYRLYNPNSGEHFYTSSQKEKKHLITLGWKDEGIGWVSPAASACPVYRLYNPNAGDHHYTMNIQEQKILIASGWKDEGIGWYSLPAGQGIPVYRQYNPHVAKAGAHHYTTNKAENDYLVSVGWKGEGFAWYAEKQ